MKLLALILSTIVFVSCSGFSKPVERPWPGQYNRELLYWCIPSGDGVWPVDIKPPKDCAEENISRGQWDHLPVTVSADESTAKETKEAVSYINLHLGFEMFQYIPDNDDTDIAVFPAGNHWWAAAMAKRMTWMGRHHGVVLVFNGYEAKDHTAMMVHELGHLLGLRHDPDSKWSIMYPSVNNRPSWLEDRDIRLLRRLYQPLLRQAP